MMEISQKTIAEQLLQIKAIKLQVTNPFTWASGWKSPIYCDNRKSLSYPNLRKQITNEFAQVINSYYPDTEVIAGVATGAIAWGVLLAEALNLPFIYVRSSKKGHGLSNQIEGDFKPQLKVTVIEDLVSTGKSSLEAVRALRQAGAKITGMAAIFSYGFPIAAKKFAEENCQLITLSNYNSLLDEALKTNYIAATDLKVLQAWRNSPETWQSK